MSLIGLSVFVLTDRITGFQDFMISETVIRLSQNLVILQFCNPVVVR